MPSEKNTVTKKIGARIADVYWIAKCWKFVDFNGNWVHLSEYPFGENWYIPTHWMPLPEPPQEGGAKVSDKRVAVWLREYLRLNDDIPDIEILKVTNGKFCRDLAEFSLAVQDFKQSIVDAFSGFMGRF